MAKNKEMTKVNALTIALELVENSTHAEKDAVANKIRKEIENLSKKSTTLTPKQTANMGLGEMVVEFLRNHPNHQSACNLSVPSGFCKAVFCPHYGKGCCVFPVRKPQCRCR